MTFKNSCLKIQTWKSFWKSVVLQTEKTSIISSNMLLYLIKDKADAGGVMRWEKKLLEYISKVPSIN